MARRRSAAAPIPPELLALRVSSVSANSVLENPDRFSWPALNLPADRVAALLFAGSHPGNTCSSDTRVPGIDRNRQPTGNSFAQTGRPSRCKVLRWPEGDRGLRKLAGESKQRGDSRGRPVCNQPAFAFPRVYCSAPRAAPRRTQIAWTLAGGSLPSWPEAVHL